jgi:D-alanyl-lipoteichoic acid acyltransferase DltB (MBOAT superfamily)
VQEVYKQPCAYEGLPLLVVIILFPFQIYCDFSGYSDIALGAAQVMGFNLMENFKAPYFSKSVGQYWQRWHISLTTWFKDYVYVPLGGNRNGKIATFVNIIIIFLLSGLWHGAHWKFVIWGALHALFIITAQLVVIKKYAHIKLVQYSQVVFTFLLISFAFVFFRAQNLLHVKHILTHTFWQSKNQCIDLFKTAQKQNINLNFLHTHTSNLVVSIVLIFVLLCFDYFNQKHNLITLLRTQKTRTRWLIYIAFSLFFVLFGVFNKSAQFIYFQF